MTRLFLVRHGQTYWNVEQRMQGWKDSPLTDIGINQAKQLSESLKNEIFNAIYTSSSGRAVQTAKILKNNRDIKIVKNDNLRELNFGNWDGHLFSELENKFPDKFKQLKENPHLFESPLGESFLIAQNRVLFAINRIILNHFGENILIISHAIVIKLIISYYKKQHIRDIWNTPPIEQTALSIIEIDNRFVNIVRYGDTSHLSEDNATY
ncbi:histidine phosphatase family protein [candidate division TA06 bacterium]|uniref:Histidine phosphatase family protein n=1 Tax=candidate division TA06 bacterium TaxID=2250710 RepID=A0A660SDR9_UNCT6|nr:MAG: histidine phosphatase family protein [candidate division TA06 bacterium]